MASDHVYLVCNVLGRYQAVISRLANSSSSYKGWAITISIAIVGFSVKDGPPRLSLMALVPLMLFYLMDAYYLTLERAFRHKSEEIVAAETVKIVVERDPISLSDFFHAAVRPASWAIYLALAATALAVGLGWVPLALPHSL